MTAKIVKLSHIKKKPKKKWSTDDAIRHLARVCNVVVQNQSAVFPTKMHKRNIESLQHSIDIVNEKYDLELK